MRLQGFDLLEKSRTQIFRVGPISIFFPQPSSNRFFFDFFEFFEEEKFFNQIYTKLWTTFIARCDGINNEGLITLGETGRNLTSLEKIVLDFGM